MAPERTETAEGHEVTVATHVLGPFLLTHLLREPLAHGDGGRVVSTSSGGMYAAALRDDDPEYEEDGYSGPKAYARTKRMQVVLAETLAERLAGDRIVVHSMHPGWVDTRGVSRYLTVFRAATVPFMRSPDQGADTLVWLVASPWARSGQGASGTTVAPDRPATAELANRPRPRWHDCGSTAPGPPATARDPHDHQSHVRHHLAATPGAPLRRSRWRARGQGAACGSYRPRGGGRRAAAR